MRWVSGSFRNGQNLALLLNMDNQIEKQIDKYPDHEKYTLIVT